MRNGRIGLFYDKPAKVIHINKKEMDNAVKFVNTIIKKDDKR